MKTIYTFSLDDSIPLSDFVKSDLREIAYLLYESLKYDFLEENPSGDSIIISDPMIKENVMYERIEFGRYIYRLESDNSSNNKYLYEPFILRENSFGITVNSGLISDDVIKKLLEKVQRDAHFNYNFTINSISYDDNNDKNSRFIAISKLNKSNNRVDTYKKIKKLIPTVSFGMPKLIGR